MQAINPELDRGGSPLFQTLFVLQDAPLLSFAGLDVTLVDIPNGGAKFDLSFSVRGMGDVSILLIEYRKEYFDEMAIDAMGRHLLTLMSGALEDVDRPAGRSAAVE